MYNYNDSFKKIPKMITVNLLIIISSLNSYTIYFKFPDTKSIIRGEYENKIRRHSPPEKIFETFADCVQDGQLLMNHSELFNAICPFMYSTK
jgi:hypothetical protein